MSSRQPGACLWCDSTDVHKIQLGLPAGDQAEWFAAASDVPPDIAVYRVHGRDTPRATVRALAP